MSQFTSSTAWPDIPFKDWKETYETLHMWTQVVGKIRLVQSSWVNHSWHVALYLTARGLTTSPIPYGDRTVQIDFDFIDHQLLIQTSDGVVTQIALRPCAVAEFYHEVMEALNEMGIQIHIYTTPSEIADAIPFEQDYTHASYDAEYANRFWRALLQSDRVFKEFRSRFNGKCSPVHFFWGSFDLAVTRFSGRTAPEHPGNIPNFPDAVAREAYSHEVSSCGFWPGAGLSYPAFYSYAYPAPDGFGNTPVRPDAAFYSNDLGEFILPYDAVREAESPDEVLLEFLQSTYDAAALGNWDYAALRHTAFK
ncbi:MAG: DUF5996 family protein [Elainellaceae cyanobacterium]